MSETREPTVISTEEASPAPPEPAPPEPARPRRGPNPAAWLAAVLLILLVLVGTSPLWAPAVAPLLPWAASERQEEEKIAALSARLDKLEATRAQEQQSVANTGSALQQLERRVGALENKPAVAPGDLAELRTQIGRLSNAQNDVAGLKQQADRLSGVPVEIADLKQQLAKTVGPVGDLANRLGALEKTVEKAAQTPAADPIDGALVLVALHIREAIDAGKPFSAELQALAALAKRRPEVAADAAALAGPAKSGVASRAALSLRLSELASAIANAEAAAPRDDWAGQGWARLRSLVTIRRIGGSGQSEAEAAVASAQRALAQGDLAGSVAALEKLTGAPADAARPWLEMARARLAAEEILQRIERQAGAHLAAGRTTGDSPGGDAKP